MIIGANKAFQTFKNLRRFSGNGNSIKLDMGNNHQRFIKQFRAEMLSQINYSASIYVHSEAKPGCLDLRKQDKDKNLFFDDPVRGRFQVVAIIPGYTVLLHGKDPQARLVFTATEELNTNMMEALWMLTLETRSAGAKPVFLSLEEADFTKTVASILNISVRSDADETVRSRCKAFFRKLKAVFKKT